MTEAPNVSNVSTKTLKYEGKIYEINLFQKSNNLIIKCMEINTLNSNQYEHEFSFLDLIKISKFFNLFENITSIIIELTKRIEENKIKITINENYCNIIIDVEIKIIDELFLQLERKDDNLNSHIITLNKNIIEQKGIINKIKKELNNKINKINEKYNKKIKKYSLNLKNINIKNNKNALDILEEKSSIESVEENKNLSKKNLFSKTINSSDINNINNINNDNINENNKSNERSRSPEIKSEEHNDEN